QWKAASKIFMLLGIAAIIQPVTKTVLWLFTTQGRSREMFHWGVIAGIIAMISIVAGLPWGAAGVATAYAVTDLCVSTPLLFWYIGRKGPVRARDFYHTIAPAAAASICALAVLLLFRPWLASFQHLFTRLGLAFALTVATSLIVLAALPAGRLALRNFKELLMLLGRKRIEPVM